MTGPPLDDRGRLHAAAIAYAEHGWPVLPLQSPVGQGCSCSSGADCSSIGKHPRTRNGLHAATTDIKQITSWWRRWPNANIGVATGERSGIVVLDIDLPDGPNSLAQLQADHHTLPPTLTQRTGSGGRQLVFTRPPRGLPSRAGINDGVDVRGDGGYIVVPPSVHACGQRYRWTNRTRAVAPPEWLVDTIRPPERRSLDPSESVSVTSSPGRYGRAALAGELLDLARAPEGARNHSLNRAAFRLGQLVGVGLLDHGEVRAQLTKTAEQIGLGARETAKTVASGMAAGIDQPRQFKPRAATRS